MDLQKGGSDRETASVPVVWAVVLVIAGALVSSLIVYSCQKSRSNAAIARLDEQITDLTGKLTSAEEKASQEASRASREEEARRTEVQQYQKALDSVLKSMLAQSRQTPVTFWLGKLKDDSLLITGADGQPVHLAAMELGRMGKLALPGLMNKLSATSDVKERTQVLSALSLAAQQQNVTAVTKGETVRGNPADVQSHPELVKAWKDWYAKFKKDLVGGPGGKKTSTGSSTGAGATTDTATPAVTTPTTGQKAATGKESTTSKKSTSSKRRSPH